MDETIELTAFRHPELGMKMLVPQGWEYEDKGESTPGAAFNRTWTKRFPSGHLINVSLIAYPLGGSTQEGFYSEHKGLYENDESVEILGFDDSGSYLERFHEIEVGFKNNGVESEGQVVFWASGGYCFIVQCLALKGMIEGVRGLFTRIFESLEKFETGSVIKPERPETGTLDAHGGWIAHTHPIPFGGDELQALVYINEEHGFGFVFPKDSEWVMRDGAPVWSALVYLPFEADGRKVALNVQVLPGTSSSSSELMDRIEEELFKARGGSRAERTLLVAPFGAVEHLRAVHIHEHVQIDSFAWAHARSDRSFLMEILLPASLTSELKGLAHFLASSFQVYGEVDSTDSAETTSTVDK